MATDEAQERKSLSSLLKVLVIARRELEAVERVQRIASSPRSDAVDEAYRAIALIDWQILRDAAREIAIVRGDIDP